MSFFLSLLPQQGRGDCNTVTTLGLSQLLKKLCPTFLGAVLKPWASLPIGMPSLPCLLRV